MTIGWRTWVSSSWDCCSRSTTAASPSCAASRPCYWMLDEIQLVAGWERFVRRVLDTERIEVIVSGSSARMLSREVHTSLRGRGMATVIRPFSLREFLRHRGQEPKGPVREFASAERSRLEKRFLEFLLQGGFPEAQDLDLMLRVELLQGYVDTVLFRDVVERHGVTQVAALRWVTRQCLRNPAASFSVHRLHQDLEGTGARRREGCRARDGGASGRCVSDQHGTGVDGVGAAAELESAQGVSGGCRRHRCVRSQRPRESRPRVGDGGAARARAAESGGGCT